MTEGGSRLPVRLLSGWAGLARFWIAAGVVLALGALTLQLLGPPEPPHPVQQVAEAAPKPPEKQPLAAEPAHPQARAQDRTPNRTALAIGNPGRSTPGPIADPDPALLVPNLPPGDGFLPCIAPDSRTSMHDYAAGFDPTTRRPRVGLILGGLGMSGADNLAAVRKLPPGVTLAVSPYARDPDRLLAAARIAQHEYLLALPMEPQGFTFNDPDERHALMTSLSPSENMDRLHWAMSRFGGYVGATSAFGPMRGERLAEMNSQFEAVLADLADRGLLFVDARPGASPLGIVWNRAVDVVIDDDPLDADAVDQRLGALEKLAQERGSALGLIAVPRPMVLDRLTPWANTLVERGLVLAPVSALVSPPARPHSETDQ